MRIHCPWRQADACCLFTVLFLSLSSSIVSAATLTGRVTDPDGAAVRGAQVVVSINNATIAQSFTDTAGGFVIEALGAGRYTVRVIADGFAADPAEVMLTSDETRSVTVMLHLAALNESVLVSAAQVDVPLSR